MPGDVSNASGSSWVNFGTQVIGGIASSNAKRKQGQATSNSLLQQAEWAGYASANNAETHRMNAGLSRMDAAAAHQIGNYNAGSLTRRANDILKIANLNKAELLKMKDHIRWRAGFQEDRLWEDKNRTIGAQEAGFSFGGVTTDANSGSPFDIAMDTVRNYALDAFVIRMDAKEELRQLDAQAEIVGEEGAASHRSLLRDAHLARLQGGIQSRRFNAQAAIHDRQASFEEEMGEKYSDYYTQSAANASSYADDAAKWEAGSSLLQGWAELI